MAKVDQVITVNLDCDNDLLVLGGLKPWNTVKDVKYEACKKAREKGVQICPEGGDVMSGDLVMGLDFLDDNIGLGSLCDPSIQYPFLELDLFPCRNVKAREEHADFMRFLGECARVRIEEDKTDGDTLRPKELPQQVQDLQIHGHLKLDGSFGATDIPLSHIEIAARAYTTATVVLLAPNDRIFEMLLSLPSRIKSEFLIVRMSWDVLSYFFVRLLSATNPDLPLVAVTDLDPHHLDLFTFLDTPVYQLEPSYGLNIWVDPDDPFLADNEYVDIKWLGLRPCQCLNPLHTSADNAVYGLTHPSDLGFNKVIRMLKVNPILRRKSEWLSALDWLQKYGKRVEFHPCNPDTGCQASLLLDLGFITKKISEKDWV